MLGWMLKRGDNAPTAADAGDTTLLDVPDTPAPVFAARALKSALFGTTTARDDLRAKPTKNLAASSQPQPKQTSALSNQGSLTPNSKKPQGILLTPGTGASRPKRVSFGNDVEDKKTQTQSNPLTSRPNEPHKRTRLNEALEKARKKKVASVKKAEAKQMKPTPPSDDEWDDEEEEDEPEDYCNHDITLDLNEPHSQSGRYWKQEFEKYHEDAKAEMEKLLKYKQLAKSYAQQKDAEAISLAEQLKDEQEKVIKMEKKIAENASQIISRHENASEDATPEMVAKLTKQTALAVQYRQRVSELENQLEDFLEDKQSEAESKGRRRRGATSPRTQKTLIETNRELRKARSQVKELGGLRDQVTQLKSQLKTAEKRADKAESEKPEDSENLRAKDLRAQLRQVREESKKKDEEIKQTKKELEEFRRQSRLHEEDTKGVIERAQAKIAELRQEIKTLKAGAGPEQVSRARPKSWHAQPGANYEDDDDLIDMEEPAIKLRNSRRVASDEAAGDKVGEWTPLAELSPQKPKFHQTLREKFREDAAITVEAENGLESPVRGSGALKDRPTLGKPKWQPFVPRSPRNRAHLSEDTLAHNENAGVTPAPARSNRVSAPELQDISKSISRGDRIGPRTKTEPQADIMAERLAKLGGPENSLKKYTSDTLENFVKNGRLPPERRAATIARIEQRRAEKRLQRQMSLDKENMRP